MTDLPAALKRSPALWLAMVTALLLTDPGAAADARAALADATERASAQYRIVMRALETQGREQTAAEVRVFRERWGEIIARFGKDAAAGNERLASALMDVEMRLVGALIVIDIGSREAAREALIPVGEALGRIRTQAAPPPR
ncbi:MAG: hypothetical protein ACRECO_06705 [Xanthobacteraceae bacterium]